MAERYLLVMRGIRKAFGPAVALDGVELRVRPGEIHGLLGGNGAGKTTLMNVLFGLYRADAGEILVRERPVHIRSPREAMSLGIGMVHQQFLQVPTFTVIENIVLGTALPNRPLMDLAGARENVRALTERFGLSLDLEALLAGLPMGVRQRVEIVKALYRGVELLILDEPTTMLTPQQVDALFSSLKVMVQSGLSVIFITHKLREVLAVSDRITVLRNGRSVATFAREEASEQGLVRAMVGQAVNVEQSLLFARGQHELTLAQTGERARLELEDLGVPDADGQPALEGWSLSVREGEVLGVAGVAGNGQHALAEALMAVRPRQGRLRLDGADVSSLPTRELLARGLAYVPENRWEDGSLARASVAHNLILGSQRRPPFSQGRFLNWGSIRTQAQRLITDFNIQTRSPEALAGDLSGGNLQRVMLARALALEPRVLILHSPTQGLDIASIEFIYQQVVKRKRAGCSTLLISENLDELFLLCNRVVIIYRGRMAGTLERGQFDPYAAGRLMSGIAAPAGQAVA
jgi:simple sugar transport system ATP-binding protein